MPFLLSQTMILSPVLNPGGLDILAPQPNLKAEFMNVKELLVVFCNQGTKVRWANMYY